MLLVRVLLTAFFTGATAWLLKSYSGLSWPITISLTLLTGLGAAFTLKLLDIKNMIAILRVNESTEK